VTAKARLTLDGREVEFSAGETILEVALRCGREIPTLCHDPRLAPAGACRTCLVEVEGAQRLLPACMTPVASGMVIHSESPRVERHRRSLLALYLTDYPADRVEQGRPEEASRVPDELREMAARFDAPTTWGNMEPVRRGRADDRNPYIFFDAERCILCARCMRYCDEVEGVSAIALSGRGAETTISTADRMSLLDSTCELCGGCIDVCPTGAMTEKIPRERGEKPGTELDPVRTTCNYCGVGCQIDLLVDREAHAGRGRVVAVASPPPGTTTNDGNLCVKGRFAYDFIDHEDRLTQPLVRGRNGELHPVSWDDALVRAAEGLLGVKQRHGAGALGFVSSSRCTMEENFLVQKLARAVFGTNNVHQCAAT
jgi:predicted molibdopterin-dependent oxidoreductase YjgC